VELKTVNTPDLPEVVVQTSWKKIGTDENGVSAHFLGATPFTANSVTPGSFVPFNQLNQNTVLDWIKAVVIGDYEKHVNDQIAKQIAAKSIQTPPLPWAPPEPPQPEPPVT
jgi:hypothetical protein